MRNCVALILLLALVPFVSAHFVFIVPQPAQGTVRVVMSESLEPDDDVKLGPVAGLKVHARDFGKPAQALTLAATDHSLDGKLVAGAKLLTGALDYGVSQRGDGPAFLLRYLPKAVIGPISEEAVTLKDTPFELVPRREGHQYRLLALANGKPQADVEIKLVVGEDGKKLKTDAKGLTAVFAAPGTFGAWAKVVEPKTGDHGGKKYSEVRHYATLVVAPFGPPPMPAPAASLGADAADGWAYVYGGHTVKTHLYNTDAVTGRFVRWKPGSATWEELPGGPPGQGLALIAHGKHLYRVGGMKPVNVPGTPTDNRSLADAAKYDPDAKAWIALPKLPAPRSSHDAAIVGDTLHVAGGWVMHGRETESEWCDHMLTLDLKTPGATWEKVPQPFERRAIATGHCNGKLYVLGGIDSDDIVTNDVDVFDPKTKSWSKGPKLPVKKLHAFGPAACNAGGKLYVGTGDGKVWRLNAAGDAWDPVGQLAITRIVYRLVPMAPDRLLVVGGAAKGDAVADVEEIEVKN